VAGLGKARPKDRREHERYPDHEGGLKDVFYRAPEPWKPSEFFDWATGGRALSEEERKILMRLLRGDEPIREEVRTVRLLGDE
jgi:hypothetical protein